MTNHNSGFTNSFVGPFVHLLWRTTNTGPCLRALHETCLPKILTWLRHRHSSTGIEYVQTYWPAVVHMGWAAHQPGRSRHRLSEEKFLLPRDKWYSTNRYEHRRLHSEVNMRVLLYRRHMLCLKYSINQTWKALYYSAARLSGLGDGYVSDPPSCGCDLDPCWLLGLLPRIRMDCLYIGLLGRFVSWSQFTAELHYLLWNIHYWKVSLPARRPD